MDTITILPPNSIAEDFIPAEYIPKGKTEYYLRNEQLSGPESRWRHLKADEIERLVKNNNTSDNWDSILVTNQFDTEQIHDNELYGFIRIGDVRNAVLQHHDLKLPVGITNSIIISSDIGDMTAIHNVSYLAHYIIGNRCILFNIDEMHTTNHAKFGNGILKEGESETVRIWLDVMNETGCRKIIPFDGMIPADAYLWAKFRQDADLQTKLIEITQNSFDEHRGYYGTLGDQCIVKNSRICKDVKIGGHCYIKGANKLKNLTIHSSENEPTQIGEGVELVNGIIGYGCHVFYGCKAVRFILGDNSNLKYGARLIHSFLGDNSTISCCEVLNNLIFPAHEQHHNNSFLIASVVLGQSNMAAGATIGSNHNSRANDNEVQAGRGFWPGLCTSIKHSCRFASFVLLAKADYPAELNIPLPFSLLNNNTSKNQLEVLPAFWWLYNMYALARNSWKFHQRDKRERKVQNIEYDSLAPDTVEEIFGARTLLELWTAKAYLRKNGDSVNKEKNELLQIGRSLLKNSADIQNQLDILGENMEKSKRNVVILKACEGYQAYDEMLHYYAVKNLLDYFKDNPETTFASMCETLKGERENEWINLGGQLLAKKHVDQLRVDIGSGHLGSWAEIHHRYDTLWESYRLEKHQHAFATLLDLLGVSSLTKEQWIAALDRAADIQDYISDQVFTSRKKDYDNPFRQSTFRDEEEMIAAIGDIKDNDFIIQVQEDTKKFKALVRDIKNKK